MKQRTKTKIKYRSFLLFSFLLLALMNFSACKENIKGPKVLDFWAMGVEGEYLKKIVPDFEDETGIKIRIQSIPWTAAHEKLLTAFAGNSMPDLFQLGNTWIPEFEMLEALEPLDKNVNNSIDINPENYFYGIWKTNQIKSVLYGIPWYVDTRVVFYRKDLLEAAGYKTFPKTWSELLDAAQKLKANNLSEYAIFLPTNEWHAAVVLAMQKRASILKDDNQYGNFSDTEFLEAFNFFTEFYREELCPVGMTQVTNIYQAMETGYFAMQISGPWNIGEFTRRLSPEYQDKWMTARIPVPDDNGDNVSLAGGSSIVISSHSNMKTEAWELVKYLSRPDNQLKFYELTGDLPARLECWQDSVFVTNPYIQPFYEQLKNVQSPPKIPEWEQIALKFQQYAESAVYGKMDYKTAMQELDNEVDMLLDKRRWIKSLSKK